MMNLGCRRGSPVQGRDGSATGDSPLYGHPTAIDAVPKWLALSRSIGPDMPPPSAADFIRAFESCRLESYQDSRGTWTIGWGETAPDIGEGLTWSQQKADSSFAARLATLENELLTHVLIELRAGQLAALLSLTWNVGLDAVRTSQLLRLVNQRSWRPASHEFLRWDHAGRKELAGLLHRRLAEALVFIADSRG